MIIVYINFSLFFCLAVFVAKITRYGGILDFILLEMDGINDCTNIRMMDDVEK